MSDPTQNPLASFDRDSLITHYLPLILGIAASLRPHLSPAIEFDDLVQIASAELVIIFERLPFYVRQRCRGAMINYLKGEWQHATHAELDFEPAAPATAFDDLTRSIEKLPERQHKVITMRIEGHTLREIGEALGVSHVRAHQCEKEAIENLKKAA
jgi:RNA polymerase sigma factor (sigma-70 family)